MISGGKLRNMRGVIYRLKRGYGLPLSIQYQLSSSVDLETGKMSQDLAEINIRRAILLPATYHKEIKYDIGYLKANSNFTYGGYVTTGRRDVIIDGKDLPKDFTILVRDDYTIICDGKRYNIKSVEQLDLGIGSYVVMDYVGGVPKNELHVEKVNSKLIFGETTGGIS